MYTVFLVEPPPVQLCICVCLSGFALACKAAYLRSRVGPYVANHQGTPGNGEWVWKVTT